VSDRRPGDAWLECACGRRHWGRFGAAGLLLVRAGERGPQVLLQHRALWSDQGGTWALPGGALLEGEEPVHGALREAAEEAGVDPAHVTVRDTYVVDHGPWAYTTAIAWATGPQHPRPTDDESLEIAWVDLADVDARPLLVAFGAAWPLLRARIEADPPAPEARRTAT
jgi:8-oxo-dGTP diphosphatase